MTQPHAPHQKLSSILESLPAHFHGETVSIRDLRDSLSGQVYGLLLFVLALPNLIPIPAPGLSAVTGLPLLILTQQQFFRVKKPWFPKSVLDRTMKTENLRALCARTVPFIQRAERFTKPRLLFLLHPRAMRIIAALSIGLSLLIMLPIPFGNALPALSICLFAIGILQRDGVFILLGLLNIALSLFVIISAIGLLLDALLHFWHLV